MTKLFPKGVILSGARATASSSQSFSFFFFSTNCKLSPTGVINHKCRISQGVAAASSSTTTTVLSSGSFTEYGENNPPSSSSSSSSSSHLSLSYSGNIRHYSSSHQHQFCGSLHRRPHFPSQNNLHDLFDDRHYTTTTIAAQAVPLSTEQRDTLLSKLIEPENNSNSNSNNDNIMNNSGGNLGKWKLLLPPSRDAITKTYHFIDFQQAWAFMTKVSILAEKMNHHPEWSNVYNRVEVTLTTHDCNGLSTKDIEMATKMDEYELELLSVRPQVTQSTIT